jgi:uncharacterized protein YciI
LICRRKKVTKRFVYFYFMKEEPDRIRAIVPSHVEYWRGLELAGHTGGPFADRSGGLITFEAESIQAATRIATDDPFVREDLLEDKWIKEWAVE